MTRHAWTRVSDRVAAGFGITAEARNETVFAMLAEGPRSRAGYWLQLVLAMAIATLGLVLGSTAVVIGAMLVSPLMTPIISLGMGLAVGSPLLVLRSFARVAASIVVVPATAALLVVALPIHEVTSEISSRTTPNVLDLAIASCCAVAGVYAAVRRGAETSSTAAGTAIGIALVPPLCVVGFGLGTGSSVVASGAALLFTANFCAILLFSVVGFVLLGYGRADVIALEARHTSESPPSGWVMRLARRLAEVFSSRFGPAVRVVMPFLLVGAVSWPLREAMREVSWEVRVRTAAHRALSELDVPAVHSALRLERRKVSLSLVAIATPEHARHLREGLEARLREVAGTEPRVEVYAVADARALADAELTLRDKAPPPAPITAACPPVLLPEPCTRVEDAGIEDAAADAAASDAGAVELDASAVDAALEDAAPPP